MKKLMIFVMSIFFFSFGTSVFAENATQLGIVTDKEEIFSTQEKDQIKQKAKVGDIQFYVFTISSLDRRNENDVARQLFKEESLGENDALLLLSAKEHKIAFTRYPNSAFDKKVEAYGGKSLLDEAFVPYAKQEDYAGGILSVFEDVHDHVLHVSASKDSFTNESSGAESIVSFLAMVGKVVGIIILIIVGVIFLFFIINNLRKRNQAVSKMNHLASLSNQLTQNVQAVEQALAPYSLYTGETQVTVANITSRLTQYKVKNENIQTWMKENAISFFNPTKNEKSIVHKEKEVEEYLRSLSRVEKELEGLHQVKKELQTAIEQAQRSFTSARDAFKQAKETHNFSFEHIEKTLHDMKDLMKNVDHVNSLDPLLTKRNMAKVVDKAVSLKNDIKELPKLIAFIKDDLESSIQISIKKITEIQEKEQLLFSDQNPFQHIEKAKKVSKEAIELFPTGDIENVKLLLTNVNTFLVEGIQLARQIVEKREKNETLIQEADALYTTIPLTLEQDVALISHKIGSEFGTTESKKLTNQIHSLKASLKEAFQLIETAKKYQHQNTQKYVEAHELLTRVVRLLSSMTKEYDTCMDAYNRLVRQKNSLAAKQTSYTRRVNQIAQKANYHYLQHSFYQATEQQIKTDIQAYGVLFTHTPIVLEDIQSSGSRIEKSLDQLEKTVQKLISDKQNAEKKLSQLKSSYTSTYNRTRSRHRGSYSSSYQSNHVDSLISQGLYADAMFQMEQTERDMHNMEQEYQRALDEERRAEQARQDEERRQREEENRRNNSYSDPGSTSSGWGNDSNDYSSPGSDSTSW